MLLEPGSTSVLFKNTSDYCSIAVYALIFSFELYIFSSIKMTEQDTKYLEDLQDEFDYRYKTIQSMGKFLFCL
jgi:hypothetical protein